MPALAWDRFIRKPGAGMPRVPDDVLDSIGFLYRTVADAEKHVREGGTCFIVGHPVLLDGGTEPVAWVPYAVSNRHVVWTGGCSVLRLNRRGGGDPAIIELDERNWHVHPNGNDVAVASLTKMIDVAIHKVSYIPTSRFISRKDATDWELGVGDEVFMVGRYVNHQGRIENTAAVRFGSISVMPQPIYNKAIGKDQLSYAVEMRSRSGFSGSFVAAYRTIATILTTVATEEFYGVLGVNWGHIVDDLGENTWLNGVVPAWQITETISLPALVHAQDEATKEWIEFQVSGLCGEAIASMSPAKAMDNVSTSAIPNNALGIALIFG